MSKRKSYFDFVQSDDYGDHSESDGDPDVKQHFAKRKLVFDVDKKSSKGKQRFYSSVSGNKAGTSRHSGNLDSSGKENLSHSCNR